MSYTYSSGSLPKEFDTDWGGGDFWGNVAYNEYLYNSYCKYQESLKEKVEEEPTTGQLRFKIEKE